MIWFRIRCFHSFSYILPFTAFSPQITSHSGVHDVADPSTSVEHIGKGGLESGWHGWNWSDVRLDVT